MKRKNVQRLAAELVDAIDAMRQEMAMQDATIQRQAADVAAMRAEYAILTADLEREVQQNCKLSAELLDELDSTRFKRDRLRAAGDALAEALRDETVDGTMAVFNETFKALNLWRELAS